MSLKSDETDADFKPPSDKLTPPPDSSTPSDEIESEAKAEDEDNEEDAEEGEDDGAEAEDEIKLAVKEAASLPEDFIEWEAVSQMTSLLNPMISADFVGLRNAV